MGNTFRSSVDQVQKDTIATPLSEDVLDVLRKQISGGTFGEGFGPLQREAGTAIRQFVSGRSSPEAFQRVAAPLLAEGERQVGNLRESFGAQGNRLSSSLAQGEGLLRSEIVNSIGSLFEQQQGQLLQALGQMFGMGTQATQPAFQLAQLGILPPDTIVQPSQFAEIAGPIAGLLEGIGSIVPG